MGYSLALNAKKTVSACNGTTTLVSLIVSGKNIGSVRRVYNWDKKQNMSNEQFFNSLGINYGSQRQWSML